MTKELTANTPFQVTGNEVGIMNNSTTTTAHLFYSVDGTNWTQYTDDITDKNTVVCDVPKYLYLKVDVDTIITTE